MKSLRVVVVLAVLSLIGCAHASQMDTHAVMVPIAVTNQHTSRMVINVNRWTVGRVDPNTKATLWLDMTHASPDGCFDLQVETFSPINRERWSQALCVKQRGQIEVRIDPIITRTTAR